MDADYGVSVDLGAGEESWTYLIYLYGHKILRERWLSVEIIQTENLVDSNKQF